MIFSISKENLLNGLKTVKPAAALRSTLPILSNVSIKTKDGRVQLSTTNLDMSVVTEIPANVEKVGGITVPVNILTELISALPHCGLRVELEESTCQLNITTDKFITNIKGIPEHEFPNLDIDNPDYICCFKIKQCDLLNLLKACSTSYALDTSRPVLTGVYLQIQDSLITAVSADGFRLAVDTEEIESDKSGINTLIRGENVKEIVKNLVNDYDVITVKVFEKRVMFELPKTTYIVQTISEQKYPDWQMIIPKVDHYTLTLNSKDFKQAVQANAIFAADSSNMIIFELSVNDSQLKLSSFSPERGNNETVLDVEIDTELDDNLKIAFNSKYLLDAISLTKDETLKIILQDNSESPCQIKFPSNPNQNYIVMPMNHNR